MSRNIEKIYNVEKCINATLGLEYKIITREFLISIPLDFKVNFSAKISGYVKVIEAAIERGKKRHNLNK